MGYGTWDNQGTWDNGACKIVHFAARVFINASMYTELISPER